MQKIWFYVVSLTFLPENSYEIQRIAKYMSSINNLPALNNNALEINLEVLPFFYEMIEMLTKSQMVVLHSGRKGGKTETVAIYILYRVLTGTCHTTIFFAEKKLINQGFKRALWKWIKKWKLEENGFIIQKSTEKITFKNGDFISEVNFEITNENPEAAAKSISDLHLVVVEEAQLVHWDFYTYIRGTLREDGAKMICMCNLQQDGTYVYELIKNHKIEHENNSYRKILLNAFIAELNRDYGKSESIERLNLIEKKKLDLQFVKRYDHIYTPWYNNTFLSQEEINLILADKESDLEFYQRQYMNEFCPRSDLLVIPHEKIKPLLFDIYTDVMGVRRIKCEELDLVDTPIKFIYGYDRGTVHNASISQNFVVFYEGTRYVAGAEVPIYDIFTRKAIIKPIKEGTKEFYIEVEKWMPELLRDGDPLYLDDAGKKDEDSEPVLQLRSGEYGVPLCAFSVVKGSGSVQNGLDWMLGARNWYIHPEAECGILPNGCEYYHWDTIYHEKTHYVYENDKATGKAKHDKQGKPIIRKFDDDFIDSVRYSLQPYRLVEKNTKNISLRKNHSVRKYKPYGNIG